MFSDLYSSANKEMEMRWKEKKEEKDGQMTENKISERRLTGGKKCKAKEDGSKDTSKVNKLRGLCEQTQV